MASRMTQNEQQINKSVSERKEREETDRQTDRDGQRDRERQEGRCLHEGVQSATKN